jgi:hypothetical protein
MFDVSTAKVWARLDVCFLIGAMLLRLNGASAAEVPGEHEDT